MPTQMPIVLGPKRLNLRVKIVTLVFFVTNHRNVKKNTRHNILCYAFCTKIPNNPPKTVQSCKKGPTPTHNSHYLEFAYKTKCSGIIPFKNMVDFYSDLGMSIVLQFVTFEIFVLWHFQKYFWTLKISLLP